MAPANGPPASPSGDQSGVEPPGPIPNPEVKRPSADDSGTTGPVKVGRRQVNAPSMVTWTGLFFAQWWTWGWFVISALCKGGKTVIDGA